MEESNTQIPNSQIPPEPGEKVFWGEALADFWLEDKNQNKIKVLKGVQVTGTQLFAPYDCVQLALKGISESDYYQATFGGKSYVQFNGGALIECLGHSWTETQSKWRPLREPLDIAYNNTNGYEISFTLFSFPEFLGHHDINLQDTKAETGGSYWWRCGQIPMEVDGWEILISGHIKTHEWIEEIRETGGWAATHIGAIRKSNFRPISWEEAKNLIKCLHNFLSFARGHWQPIGNIRLLDSEKNCTREMWGLLPGGSQPNQSGMTWWSPHPMGHELKDAFKGFWKIWNNPIWTEPLIEIIYWYLQANLGSRGQLGCDSALILSQAALEKLAWIYITRSKEVVSEEDFASIKRASDKFRLLATHLEIPQEIPGIIESLKEDMEGNIFEDAFHAITDIRNQLVHPKRNRELKDRATFDAWNLSQWYIEMFLLRLMKYEGHYANRIRIRKWAGEIDQVPWIKKDIG
ncbi:hypothetical protein Dalk_4473 [Desulfatibacillum aliphaticivorans]|uniref:YopA central domain-containing protein n=1 Tax=Desulfatibacillum aliphaticivorans TaxID=218208 RepID=B8FCI9_DESAL|nr:hypothetical protein [Desulfatibacillum aliphaticivorans]ACL06152.1 hypothetical protein Dalk_4473 [Desulfatibacillum aliphaticivorans]